MSDAVFSSNRGHSGERNMDDLELPMFDFNTLTMATNNFSEANKLGQGGFGSVYRVGPFFIAAIITQNHNAPINTPILTGMIVAISGQLD